MRKSFAACVLILLQAFVVLPQKPINHGGKIESRYDGVEFETLMRLRKMKVDCGGFKDNFTKDSCVSIDVVLHCPGTQLSHVGTVTLQVIFETKRWDQSHEPNQRDLIVVVDTETVKLGRMRLVPQTDAFMQTKTTETLEATISYGLFKKISQSQSLELRIGPSMIALTDKNLLALKDLDSRLVK